MSLPVVLGENIALIFSLTYLYGLLRSSAMLEKRRQKPVVDGLIFGVFGILALSLSYQPVPGIFLDTRSAILVIAGAFGGPVSAVISAVMIGAFRTSLGGAGVFPSLVNLTTVVLVGSCYYWYRRSHQIRHPYLSFYLTGLAVGASGVLWPLLLGNPAARNTVPTSAPALMVLIPAATLALGGLLTNQDRQAAVDRALRESEERFRMLIRTITEGVIQVNADNSIGGYNPSAERMLGVTAEVFQKRLAEPEQWAGTHEDGSPFAAEKNPILVALETGKPQMDQLLQITRPDGKALWFLSNVQPMFRPGSAKPYAAVATMTDVTERRQVEEAIARDRDLLRALIDNIPDAIFVKDRQGRYENSNTAYNQLAGVPNSEALHGKTAFDVFAASLAEQYDQDDNMVLESGKALLNVERATMDSQGSLRITLTSKIPLFDSSGTITGLVGISRDITDRKQLERQAIELAAERERARVLHRFISDISHDFRTPLSVINTSVYLASRSPDLQKRDHYLKRIEEESAHIEHLLRDMLEMSILQQPNSAYYFEEADIYALVREIASEYVPISEARNRALVCDIPLVPEMILFDRTHIKRAVAELIENALNFTAAAGHIQVRAAVTGDDVALTVQDDGIGISPEDQTRIFEQFFRVDQARSTATGGTGLGLPIVKKIVEAHGGKILVKSEPDSGSTFTILLPRNKISAKDLA